MLHETSLVHDMPQCEMDFVHQELFRLHQLIIDHSLCLLSVSDVTFYACIRLSSFRNGYSLFLILYAAVAIIHRIHQIGIT